MDRSTQNVELPAFGRYGTGICYTDAASRAQCEEHFARLAKECGLEVLCWRDVPVDSSKIGLMARKSEPVMRQVFLTGKATDDELNRQVSETTLLYGIAPCLASFGQNPEE